MPYLELKPSEYVRRQVYGTTRPLGKDPDFIRACLESIGVDRVVFGSD